MDQSPTTEPSQRRTAPRAPARHPEPGRSDPVRPAPQARANVIPAAQVRSAAHPVLVDTSSPAGSGLTVVPIVEAGRVAGFEIRCRCGCNAFVECLPAEETTP